MFERENLCCLERWRDSIHVDHNKWIFITGCVTTLPQLCDKQIWIVGGLFVKTTLKCGVVPPPLYDHPPTHPMQYSKFLNYSLPIGEANFDIVIYVYIKSAVAHCLPLNFRMK